MRNGTRSQQKNDVQVFGSGVPMVTADGFNITINAVVFEGHGEVNSYYGFKPTIKITAYRVIQINYKSRYIRLRNAEGCEHTRSYDEGCPTAKIYCVMEKVQDAAQAGLQRKIKKYSNRIIEIQATINKCNKVIAEMRATPTNVEIPNSIEEDPNANS